MSGAPVESASPAHWVSVEQLRRQAQLHVAHTRSQAVAQPQVELSPLLHRPGPDVHVAPPELLPEPPELPLELPEPLPDCWTHAGSSIAPLGGVQEGTEVRLLHADALDGATQRQVPPVLPNQSELAQQTPD